MSNSSSELVDFFIKKQGAKQGVSPWTSGLGVKSSAGRHRTSSAGSAVKSDINVTPLVDVCLVLLIIFMVVTPLLQQGVDGRTCRRPRKPGEDARGRPSSSTSPSRPDGSVFVGEKWVPDDQPAEGCSRRSTSSTPEKDVVLKGDRRLKYKRGARA